VMYFPIWVIFWSLLAAFTAWEMTTLVRAGGGVRWITPAFLRSGFTTAACTRESIRACVSPLGSSSSSHTHTHTHSKHFSSSHPNYNQNAKMATSASSLISLLKNRRTYYSLSASSPISDSQIESIVKDILLQSPSSFNSQSTRVVVLFKEEHVKLWEIAKEAIKAVVPAEAYPASEQRLNGFQKAYGTVSSLYSLLF
jgi:hypothetical protein